MTRIIAIANQKGGVARPLSISRRAQCDEAARCCWSTSILQGNATTGRHRQARAGKRSPKCTRCCWARKVSRQARTTSLSGGVSDVVGGTASSCGRRSSSFSCPSANAVGDALSGSVVADEIGDRRSCAPTTIYPARLPAVAVAAHASSARAADSVLIPVRGGKALRARWSGPTPCRLLKKSACASETRGSRSRPAGTIRPAQHARCAERDGRARVRTSDNKLFRTLIAHSLAEAPSHGIPGTEA